MLRQIIAIILLTTLGALCSLISGRAPLPWAASGLEAGEIRSEDARKLEVIWVDARSEAEYAEGHLPRAIFYDPADPASSMAEILEEWFLRPRVIVVYCANEGCGTSRKVAAELRANLPDAKIYSLKGGWAAWEK